MKREPRTTRARQKSETYIIERHSGMRDIGSVWRCTNLPIKKSETLSPRRIEGMASKLQCTHSGG